jgi:hypothetical protein
MTEAELEAHLSELIAMQGPVPDPNHFERALVLLRLAATDDFSPETSVSEQVAFIYGFYRFGTKDIVLVDHGEDSTPEVSSAVLVHELVHALQDQDVGLEGFTDEYATSTDSYLAVDSLIEGEARLHELRYAAAGFGYVPGEIDYRRLFQNGVETLEQDLLSEPLPYVRGTNLFPYVWGSRYAHLSWGSGGRDAILARYASPVLTTRTLMASVDAPEIDAGEPAAIAGPVPPAEWAPFAETTLGAFGLFMFQTKRTGDVEEARASALAWQNDRLFVFRGQPDGAATALSWRIDLVDEAAAAKLRADATTLGSTNVQQQGARVVIGLDDAALPLSWAFGP